MIISENELRKSIYSVLDNYIKTIRNKKIEVSFKEIDMEKLIDILGSNYNEIILEDFKNYNENIHVFKNKHTKKYYIVKFKYDIFGKPKALISDTPYNEEEILIISLKHKNLVFKK